MARKILQANRGGFEVSDTKDNKVVSMGDFIEHGKYNVDYIVNKENKVIGVTHPDWPFTIMRDQETNSETAIVCNNTDEPFGVLDSDVFNTVILCWLLIDDPKLIDDSASTSKDNQ